ncbi:MAG: acyltransferase family protein [Eubacterium sp.]
MSNNRIAKWDNVKIFLMFTVVLGHLITYYTAESTILKSIYFFIYIFHMPAFVFVSGLLMKKTIKLKRYDKIFSYLILGFIIKFLKFFIDAVTLKSTEIKLFDENTVAWYAFAIFIFGLVTIYLQRFNRLHIFLLALVVGIVAGYDSSADTFLSLGRIFAFYIFFYAGFCLEPQKIIDFTNKIWVKIISAIVFFATAIVVYLKIDDINWLLKLLKGKNPYEALSKLEQYAGLFRLGHYIIAFALIFAVIALIPNVKTFFTKLGSRTLSIYTFHTALIYVLRRVFDLDDVMKAIWPAHYEMLTFVVVALIILITSLKPLNDLLIKLINPKLLKNDGE